MKKQDLHGLPLAELQEHLQDAQTELSNLKFQQATHQLQNPLRLRMVRKTVARLKTLLKQEELGIRSTPQRENA